MRVHDRDRVAVREGRHVFLASTTDLPPHPVHPPPPLPPHLREDRPLPIEQE